MRKSSRNVLIARATTRGLSVIWLLYPDGIGRTPVGRYIV
jgi:hypothetical protein